ncbi:MAG: Holliday junction resolvase RuvX [Terrimesophilobacter sp.]
MRHGVRVGIDVGKVRIGVARSDSDGMIATPVATVARGAGDVAEIVRIAAELEALEFIVGLPLALSGRHTASTGDAVGFAEVLAAASTTPVRMVDERLSTVSAARNLRASGRTAKRSRAVIDQAAAVIILQHALDFERTGGNIPGAAVVPPAGP